MIHGPCGKDNPRCACTKNNKCTKNFPKDFNNHTYIDGNGYPVYRRQDTGASVEKNGVFLDNRNVVGYNASLLKRYQSHINIEWCNQLGSIKYLFKYINKGPDWITVGFSNINKQSANQEDDNQNAENEIKNYFDCRYVSACEAAWRLFGFEIHHQTPHVERLCFHLEGEHYESDKNVDEILSKECLGKTQFTEWMECNKSNELARQLTYAEFPTHFVWNQKSKVWTQRKGGYAIGRIAYVPPKAGEAFYLRILLNKVKGPTSYKDIKTTNNFTYDTFRDACYALGLLDDDKEYIECIEETSKWASASYCRSLFVMLITSDSLSRPDYVWENTWQFLCEDIVHNRRKELQIPDLSLDECVIKNIALAEIEVMLKASSMSLKNIPNMPYPDFGFVEESCNMLIQQELSYDKELLKQEHDHLYSQMTTEQKNVYNEINDAVVKGDGGVFFVYGYGGTGKTFLWKTLSSKLQSEGRIVLNVASSGIAALLLTEGRIAHSRFAIPIKLNEDSFCNISYDSHLAALLRKTDMIVWDEAPMMHKHCFEAFDRTLRDKVDPAYSTTPFVGKVMVFGGYFRQILPVITKGSREDVVNASLNSSYIWKHCRVLTLTINMRLQTGSNIQDIEETKEFANWILDIGEGKVGGSNDGDADKQFPDDVLLQSDSDHVHSITECIYPSINDHLYADNYFQDRAILVPTNDEVDSINDYMLSLINNEETTYLSSDSVCSNEMSCTFEESLYSSEVLNSFKLSGFPHHKLSLKIGVPVMLLRNIDLSKGLCNGTRLQFVRLGTHIIEAKILSGKNVGKMEII